MVKDHTNIVKIWVCLFTCLNIRAIHLEIVDNMSSESFLLYIRRFIGRRGKPSMIISDNTSQIKLGILVMDKVWDNVTKDSDVQSCIVMENIKWKSITEYAPWKGGFYERLVGITKRSLKKAIGRCIVTREQMSTIIVEIEAIVNSRPLMYLDDDINSGEALTPAHFLSVNYKTGVPDVNVEYRPNEGSSKILLESWKRGQIQLNNFWKIWINDYLQSLRETHTVNMKPVKGEITRKPQIGEVVIIKEEGVPRGRWKLATIESMIESGVDGVHRAANLITCSGRGLKRPLRLIYPLEGSNIKEGTDEIDNEINIEKKSNEIDKEFDGTNDIQEENKRNKITAATRARDKIRGIIR